MVAWLAGVNLEAHRRMLLLQPVDLAALYGEAKAAGLRGLTRKGLARVLDRQGVSYKNNTQQASASGTGKKKVAAGGKKGRRRRRHR